MGTLPWTLPTMGTFSLSLSPLRFLSALLLLRPSLLLTVSDVLVIFMLHRWEEQKMVDEEKQDSQQGRGVNVNYWIKNKLYFFIGKLFLLPGKITRTKHENPVSCLKGCQMPQMILVGLFNSAKVSTQGIFFRTQRPKSEAYRGELFFQDSRCVCETTRYGANWFHPWETGDFSKLCLWSWLMQFPISTLKCALINSNIKATK